ncbi:MAG: hypothetical protein U0797_13990 [Gemmataceae bacterium]
MSVLYVSLLIALALVQLLLRLRVNRLEKRYVRVATEAHALLNKSGTRRGNSNQADPLTAARAQYELAQLGLKRDRAEARYLAGQASAEKLGRLRGRLASYKGRLLPYAVGALDVVGALLLLDRYGVGVAQVKALLGLAA